MVSFDEGLLSPVSVGHDELVSDGAILDALIAAEKALAGAYADLGMLSPADLTRIEPAFDARAVDLPALAAVSVAGGNPVIPLVGLLKARAPEDMRQWVHRGATSQDIVDTAMFIVAQKAVSLVREALSATLHGLERVAVEHGDQVVAARTLTQHAVPTTVAARTGNWTAGILRARERLGALELPAQLAGAAGTRASFVEITGSAAAANELVAAYARRTGLHAPAAPWHVVRWPVTELGDALVQTIDALGKLAADVATLSRTEIGEVCEEAGGGSSAMPQKQNPVAATLIRSAALRAPQFGATLHLAAASAGDERPDGAWHAEWQTLRELLRLALGASAHAASLATHLRVNAAAGARNLALTGGLLVSERLAIVLVPRIGRERFGTLISAASEGADLPALVRALPEADDLDVDALLDPANYTGVPHGEATA
ncbi:lyase family protein [Microbacterium sp. W4I20]|uniref:lyase family protein n=1 Tax=Microbacterium sp. W4I20 TaxID=3042262 RepID=UPI00277F9E56|nr:lyase family protein [Microbacterium sp. W4I20]MDQ0726585.1 3-carboxy-cis,cis-muconate cycloisomerase [Microbacterium sp. W4I20]